MEKKPIDEKELQMAKDFYRLYGIAEWHEKTTILSTEEKSRALTDLKNGTPSELVAMLKCPFPTFCRLYFGQYPTAQKWFKDPAMGYKLYFLDDNQLRFFAETTRHPEMTITQIKEVFKFPNNFVLDLSFIQSANLEELPKLLSSSGQKNKTYQKKFAYLTQYIDFVEACQLGLTVVNFFEKGKENFEVFDLEGKLASLNPAIRRIITLYLGLYGEKRCTNNEIAQMLNITLTPVNNVLNMLFPRITQTLETFQRGLGFNPEKQESGNMLEYTNKTFRDLDISVQTKVIYNSLKDTEREVLSSYTNKELTIYLAQKYMFKTPESLARNMILSVKDAEKRFGQK